MATPEQMNTDKQIFDWIDELWRTPEYKNTLYKDTTLLLEQIISAVKTMRLNSLNVKIYPAIITYGTIGKYPNFDYHRNFIIKNEDTGTIFETNSIRWLYDQLRCKWATPYMYYLGINDLNKKKIVITTELKKDIQKNLRNSKNLIKKLYKDN
jgi:uncharacterized protein (DUF1015 family)